MFIVPDEPLLFIVPDVPVLFVVPDEPVLFVLPERSVFCMPLPDEGTVPLEFKPGVPVLCVPVFGLS